MSGDPMVNPVCLVENVGSSFCVSDGAIRYLEQISQPVMVVSVVGLYRTGKSYLMNRLAGKRTGFALGSTIESETKGIWMWCVPHPNKPDHTLVLLDTEGLGDVKKGDSKNDTWIFCLAVLLSSTLVYNSRGTIDNIALEQLHFVTQLAEHIKVKSPTPAEGVENKEEEEEEDSQFVKFFPNFIWAVRDFSLELTTREKGPIKEDEYLDNALQLKKGISQKISDYNVPRQCIRSYFPSRKCFVFPMPATPESMSKLENLGEANLHPGFLEVSQRFCDHVFTESRVKTLKGGHRVTGRMFSHLVRLYVETISSGNMPCLENAVVTLAQIENQAAVQEGLKVYQSGMAQVRSSFPVSADDILDEHQKWSQMATTEFMKRSFQDQEGKYISLLTEKVDEHYSELLGENASSSEQRCWQLLSKLSKDLNDGRQKGEYTKPGGYAIYCSHRDSVISQYQSQPGKGVKAEDVLEAFLSETNVEANFILQADNSLKEKDKEIQKQREKAALEEQQKKALEEKHKELQRAQQVEGKRHEERMQQMETKFEEEKRLQVEELEKAMQRKLAEQEDLIKKNYYEKAELMRQEIDQLKDEIGNNSQSFFQQTVLPLIDTGVDVFSKILHFKLMKSVLKSSPV
ncbi:guanylate-binding protein 1 [Astyanax mexicanus]|uniref:guanylate-binding protein 1 n=1 Tax=Astyanax mexicanus TaxID=7994 RepID=UPI0020CAB2E5|nr:guanylate-binding protein 1 [Astyanax mexicanus]